MSLTMSLLPPSTMTPHELNSRLSETLHSIALRILLVDTRGALCYANQAAQSALQSGCGLLLRGGVLRTAVSAQQTALDKAIAEAAGGDRCLLELGGEAASRLVAVVPLGGRRETQEPLVLLLSGQYDPLDPTVLALFAKATGLTPSEREVMMSLCEGARPQDIAAQRSVSLATVRAQIGAIRGKVGASTISDVVRKVSALPPISAGRTLAAVLGPRDCRS